MGSSSSRVVWKARVSGAHSLGMLEVSHDPWGEFKLRSAL